MHDVISKRSCQGIVSIETHHHPLFFQFLVIFCGYIFETFCTETSQVMYNPFDLLLKLLLKYNDSRKVKDKVVRGDSFKH